MADDVRWSTSAYPAPLRKSSKPVDETVEPLDYATVLRYARGQATFAKLMRWTPSSIAAACEIGRTMYDQGRLTEARTVFECVTEANPHDGYAMAALGAVYRALDRDEQAETALEAALSIRPDLAFGWIQLVELLIENRRHPEARQRLTRALTHVETGPMRDRLLGLEPLLALND